jgi:class 3 adenylate cyclase
MTAGQTPNGCRRSEVRVSVQQARSSGRVVAVAAWIVVTALSVAASALSAANGRPPEIFLPLGISGVVYAASGAVMYAARPGNRAGIALLIAAAIPALLVILRYLAPVTLPINDGFGQAGGTLPLVYLFLSFPSGNLAGRAERWTFWVTVAAGLLLASARAIALDPPNDLSREICQPCTSNPILFVPSGLFDIVDTVSALAFVALFVLVSVVIGRRWLGSRGFTRKALTPLLPSWLALAVSNVLILVVLPRLGISGVSGTSALLVRIVVPIALVVVFLRFYATRSGVARALVRLGPGTSVWELETTLRRSLDEPDLIVAFWSEMESGYVDARHERVELEAKSAAKDVLMVERDQQPLGIVVHDAALSEDPEMLAIMADTVRNIAEVFEMHDELIARGGDVSRLPKGIVTFLFGDIEGSTQLLDRLGHGYKDVLAEVRTTIRRGASSGGGEVVDIRADDCFLAFHEASGGLTAALEIQRALRDRSMRGGIPVRLRIGLHTGQPELTRTGYVGMDLHRAARIMALAKGGQIFASKRFVGALDGVVPELAQLNSLGLFTLRGIEDEEEIFEVQPA